MVSPAVVWPESHCLALQSLVGVTSEGSYRDIATTLNRLFPGAHFTRNSCIGKAKRMGLVAANPLAKIRKIRGPRMRVVRRLQAEAFIPAADIVPLNLTLIELRPNDCRFPYGDKDFLFCANPKMAGSSFCPGHSRLCWNSERVGA